MVTEYFFFGLIFIHYCQRNCRHAEDLGSATPMKTRLVLFRHDCEKADQCKFEELQIILERKTSILPSYQCKAKNRIGELAILYRLKYQTNYYPFMLGVFKLN